MSESTSANSAAEPVSRRHDLDALRGWAMLLGIVLHASMSFFPVPWWVQDPQQNGLFGLLFLGIHGFRMPLFFLLSGYFTMLVYRRKGLSSLLKQRALRILLPCLLGLVTVHPLLHVVGAWAGARVPRRPPAELPPLFAAIRSGDASAVQSQLRTGIDLAQPDPVFQIRPLHWGALGGNPQIVADLVEANAPLDQGDGQGNVPLNAAAFAGHAAVVEFLLEHGANPNAVNQEGRLPIDVLEAPVEMTAGILQYLGLPPPNPEALAEGRRRAGELLTPVTQRSLATAVPRPAGNWLERVVRGYFRELRSKKFEITWRGQPFHLVSTGVFDHLWFLWFLVWMIVAFALVVWWLPERSRTADSAAHPGRWANGPIWGAIAATAIPQAFMGSDGPSLGPDTSTGWLVPPHLLMYYGLFFAVGCWMYSADHLSRSWTRHWKGWLTLSLVVLFPVAVVCLGSKTWSIVVQPLYAWLMSLGCLGLFERYLAHPSSRLRYLSDSSYWLYIAHMPVVVALQSVVSRWPGGAVVKFGLVMLAAIPLLLLSYHLLVRPTPLGWLLNGRIERRNSPRPQHAPPAA
jgi:peptidoglycan/LPS O-acetylase OafA/YrhL